MFFIFPDVSIRQRGRYRLGVTLINIMKCACAVILPDLCSRRSTLAASDRRHQAEALEEAAGVTCLPQRGVPLSTLCRLVNILHQVCSVPATPCVLNGIDDMVQLRHLSHNPSSAKGLKCTPLPLLPPLHDLSAEYTRKRRIEVYSNAVPLILDTAPHF